MISNLTVEAVHLAPGDGAFFYDDQAAIRAGVKADGFIYTGAPLTPGFAQVRVPAQSLGIGLALSDGAVVWGDMMSVQYSGAGGRDPLFSAAGAAGIVRKHVSDQIIGLPVANFRHACSKILHPLEGASPLPMAVQYGVSQALLRAAGHAHRRTMTEVLCTEFGLPVQARPVPLYAQSGDSREINVDKMILKRVDILPHGLINSRDKFGADGERFLEFIRWVASRVRHLAESDYAPVLHFDIYGWAGLVFDQDVGRVADYLARAQDFAQGFALQIESPIDFGERERHIEGYVALAAALEARGSAVKLVVDERCNTRDDIEAFAAARAGHIIQIKTPDVGSIEDIVLAALACKRAGVGAYMGGSCVETELSAQVCVHAAIAVQADMMLAKPGMGVDEAVTITRNEQARVLALLSARNREQT